MTQTITDFDELTESQFVAIGDMVRELCGINLHQGKKALVRARLSRRLRLLGLRDFGRYISLVRNDATGQEANQMLEALCTNLTYFFREPPHFQLLQDQVVSAIRRRHSHDRRIRIWSAGCSTGEEPYSIAMTLREAMDDIHLWDVGILATDLSRRVIRIARDAVYDTGRLRKTPKPMIRDNFTMQREAAQCSYRVKDHIREMVHFACLNLMSPWPMKGQFDVIFCRNVMIYFDQTIQAQLIRRFWNQLAPGGMLFVGHSESLTGIDHEFRYVQPTVYEKL